MSDPASSYREQDIKTGYSRRVGGTCRLPEHFEQFEHLAASLFLVCLFFYFFFPSSLVEKWSHQKGDAAS